MSVARASFVPAAVVAVVLGLAVTACGGGAAESGEAPSPPPASARATALRHLSELSGQTPGAYAVSAQVLEVTTCPPCQPPTPCTPCAPPSIRVGDEPGGLELTLETPDASRYRIGGRYRFTVRVEGATQTLLGATKE